MWLSKRIITAHPVGGAPMGRDPSVGVCDPYGEVFGYPGLYIADGAAMPGPVGPNPSLTIAALADRMSSRLLDKPPATTVGGADLVRAGAVADPEPQPTARDPERTWLASRARVTEVRRRWRGCCRSRWPSGSRLPPTI